VYALFLVGFECSASSKVSNFRGVGNAMDNAMSSATIAMPNIGGRKLEKRCRYCGKVAEVSGSTLLDNERFIELVCGHSYTEKTRFLPSAEYAKIETADGQKPYPFQIDGLRHLEGCEFRGLIADEMGLGKTVQACIALKSHSEILPALVCVRSQLQVQWFHEILRWTGLPAQEIVGKAEPSSVFKIWIVSMDLLRNAKWLETIQFKTLVIDECQHLKNPEAKRTHAVRKLAARAEHIIALSGTPIKNHAGEYFTILNMLKPEKFPSLVGFYRNWVDVYNDGYKTRVGGIKSYRVQAFQEFTKDFIIRRTRDQVLPDLPKVRRNFRATPFEGAEAENQYRAVMQNFLKEYDDSGATDKSMMNLLAYIAKLRHIAGIAKINPATDFIMEFLNSTDRKIVVFHHHHDVGDLLKKMIEYEISIAENGVSKTKVIQLKTGQTNNFDLELQFKNDPDCRVLIASSLASGEGKNWQFCSDVLVVERQWNSVNETQAEGRFTRPGSTAEFVSATYLQIPETVDDYFAEIVNRKMTIFTKTMDHRDLTLEESAVLRELVNLLATKGRRAWRL
jgi:SNF2 family DNA or RNA helicase